MDREITIPRIANLYVWSEQPIGPVHRVDELDSVYSFGIISYTVCQRPIGLTWTIAGAAPTGIRRCDACFEGEAPWPGRPDLPEKLRKLEEAGSGEGPWA